jgi:hypothetical protein
MNILYYLNNFILKNKLKSLILSLYKSIFLNYRKKMSSVEKITLQIKKLPPYLLSEVELYIDFLQEKKTTGKKKSKFKLNWAGALKEFNTQYSSIELQKKALEWRSEF